MYSEYTQSALEILRHPSQTMHWYIIPILLVLIYIISREMHDKHYQVLAGGVALWGMDLFNETWNSMVCFISGYAPVWGTPMGVGDTSLLILIGYLPVFATAFYVHDRPTLKQSLKCDAAILGFDAILLIVCGFAGWL